ncbi:MAG: hypothetical protein AAGA75_27990 [Cyanobacteria bacterium P01_E01_bin.6]
MKLDPAVSLLMLLFTIMVGATSVSTFWGYALGRQALSGITQPDIRRTGATNEDSDDQPDAIHGQTVLKSESEILAQVTVRMNGTPGSGPLPDAQAAPVADADAAESPIQNASDDSAATRASNNSDVSLVTYQQSLPLSTENNQVILAVHSVQRQRNTVQVSLSLQNVGDRPVEFLYSLMDVLDEDDQSLSVSTDGLPQEIPPTGETFQGSVTIPSILLGTSGTFSLRLTDYPNQQVELQINDIPITQ